MNDMICGLVLNNAQATETALRAISKQTVFNRRQTILNFLVTFTVLRIGSNVGKLITKVNKQEAEIKVLKELIAKKESEETKGE